MTDQTKVTIGETYGKQKVGNLTIENCRFWGRPNFSGELDRFKDDRRKFTVIIPNEAADMQNPTDITREKGPDVWIIMGENREKLNSRTVGLLDRSRVENLDIEIRGWEYDPDENPGALSARLVALVAVLRPNLLDAKYGRLS